MPSTFSPNLRIELIGSGEAVGTWGNLTNNNLGDLLEQAISGATDLDVTLADITLTALNGVTDQARSAVLSITGTPGVTRVITIPNVSKTYTVKNRSDSTVNIKTASGSPFAIPTLSEAYIYCDANNVITGRIITDGAEAFNSNPTPLNNLALTGAPTAPTAAFGTNTTQVATTAFVQTALQAVFPVGSVYINASVTTSPATLFGFGTWAEIGAGRVLVGQDIGDNAFNTMGETGGSKDAIVVAHTHTGTTASTNIDHSHNFSATTGATDLSHAHTGSGTTSNNNVDHTHSGTTGSENQNHTHAGSGTTSNNNVDHTHSGTTGNENQTHTHSGTTGGNNVDHVHGFNGTTSGVGDHQHFAASSRGGAGGADPSQGLLADWPSSRNHPTSPAGAHSHTFSGTTGGQNTGHVHGFSTGGQSVNHQHAFSTGGQSTAHVHTYSFTTGGISNNHQHAFSTGGQSTAHVHTYSFTTSTFSGNHTHSVSGTSAGMNSNTTHAHTFTTNSTGSSGTNANLQPYIVVKMWQRTA